MQIVLCEDNKEHCGQIAAILKEVTEENNWNVEILCYTDGEILLEELRRRMEEKQILPEMIISDIKIPGLDGISLGKILRKEMPEICFILLTAFAEYAIEGYETGAYRYLLKPMEKEQITPIIAEVYEKTRRDRSFSLKRAEEGYDILKDVLYISAEDKYLVIHTVNGNYLDRGSLQDYEDELTEQGFFRIHRKYLLNMRYHKSIRNGKVILGNGELLPLSRRKEASYHNTFMKFLEGGLLQ